MIENLKRARWGTSALFYLHGLIVSTWLSRIPAVQTALQLRPGELGLALLGTAMGALISMPLTGALVARRGSRPVATISTILMCCALPLIPLANSRWTLTGALVVFGVFSGAMNVSMNAQAVVIEQRYGRAIMSSFHALFSLGGMTGASLGSVAASLGVEPLRHFGIATAVYVVSAVIAGRTLIFSDRGIPGQKMFARITRPLLGLGCLAFCILLNEGAMADWSSVYLRKVLITSEGTAAAGYAVFSFAMAGGRLLGDRLTERFGRVAIVRGGSLLAACGLSMGLLLGHPAVTLLAYGLVGAGFSIIVPLTFGAAGRNGGGAGAGLAAVNTAGYLGFLTGPAIIGLAADAVGLRLALGLVVVLSVAVSALARAVAIPAAEPVRAVPEPVLQ